MMADCDSCGDREGKHRSRGGSLLCHNCTHELGLGHSHIDPIVPLHPTHVIGLVGVELKDHLAAYLDEVKGDG